MPSCPPASLRARGAAVTAAEPRATHLALVLYAGDYREASRRLTAGLPDQYRHHGYALGSLARARAAGSRVTVVQFHAREPYDEVGEDGIRFLGLATASAKERAAQVAAYLAEEAVTHVMVRFPAVRILRHVVESPARVAVVLADSFPSRFRNRERYRDLGAVLQDDRVEFVSNHHLNASRQLVDVLGVDAAKVVPWDWPLDLTGRAAASPKQRPNGDRLGLCYVGSIERTKGVWDLLDAVALLRRRGEPAVVEIAGSGDLEEMWARVDRLGLRDHVVFHGRLGGGDVLDMMTRSAFVCVPSRRSYPEGLPLTLYEAMASGSPIVASDHPMFAGVMLDGRTGFVFRGGRPRRLAAAVLRGWRDPERYAEVSRTAAAAYARLGLDTVWGDLLLDWVASPPGDRTWFRGRSLPEVSDGWSLADRGRPPD